VGKGAPLPAVPTRPNAEEYRRVLKGAPLPALPTALTQKSTDAGSEAVRVGTARRARLCPPYNLQLGACNGGLRAGI
jgi:hypothetical protein